VPHPAFFGYPVEMKEEPKEEMKEATKEATKP